MKMGLMVDLHDTLLESSIAWIKSFYVLIPGEIENCVNDLSKGISRRTVAKTFGVSYDIVLDEYRKHLKPREEVYTLIQILSNEFPLVIVSNSSRDRIEKDIALLPSLNIERVYSKENGKKPDRMYLESILENMSWDSAILIGNNLVEDRSTSERITSIIFPINRFQNYKDYLYFKKTY